MKPKHKIKYAKLTDLMEFGQLHKGKTIQSMIDNDIDFLDWAFKSVKGFNLSGEALKVYNEKKQLKTSPTK